MPERRRAPIGMGDALTAVSAVEAAGDPGLLDDVLRILGLFGADAPAESAPEPPPPAAAGTTPTARPDVAGRASDQQEAPDARPDVAGRASDQREPPDAPTSGSVVIEPLPAEPPAALDLVDDAEPLEWLTGASMPVPYRPPVARPLIRTAVAVLVRRPRTTRRPDIAALVARVASAGPVEVLPMLVDTSLSDGVVVFADRGPEMEPYRQDVHFLIGRVQGTVGAAATRVVWLPREEDYDSAPVPVPDCPALVVSALGRPESASMDPDADLCWSILLDLLDGSPHGYTVLTPHPQVAEELLAAGRHAVTWDDLPSIGRGRD